MQYKTLSGGTEFSIVCPGYTSCISALKLNLPVGKSKSQSIQAPVVLKLISLPYTEFSHEKQF